MRFARHATISYRSVVVLIVLGLFIGSTVLYHSASVSPAAGDEPTDTPTPATATPLPTATGGGDAGQATPLGGTPMVRTPPAEGFWDSTSTLPPPTATP
jgi:hypothetical protein